jgi:hypothetical protein
LFCITLPLSSVDTKIIFVATHVSLAPKFIIPLDGLFGIILLQTTAATQILKTRIIKLFELQKCKSNSKVDQTEG